MHLRSLSAAALRSIGLLPSAHRLRAAVRVSRTRALHVASECLYRLPNPWLALRLHAASTPEMKRCVTALRRDGIVMLPNFIHGERLREMQARFDQMIAAIRSAPPSSQQPAPPPWQDVMYREQAYDPEIETTFTNDPFKFDRALLEVALDPFILEVIARYLGRRVILQQAIASRYDPTTKRDFGSWQWHHDAWGRKVNVMVLFTDVTLRDQYMSYLKKSHRLIHSYDRTVLNSRFTEAEVMKYPELERLDCTGPAGTVLIFDANGLHRGNRSLGAYRDTLISGYNAGRYVWKFTIPRGFVAGLSDMQRRFLERNVRVEYR